MPLDTRMFGKRNGRLARMQHMVGVEAVYDFDVVPIIGERASQTAHLNRVAAEAVRRVKGSEMKEVEGPDHAAACSITSII